MRPVSVFAPFRVHFSADALIDVHAADAEAFSRTPADRALCHFNPAGHLTEGECAHACYTRWAPSQTSEDCHCSLQTFTAVTEEIGLIKHLFTERASGTCKRARLPPDYLALRSPDTTLQSVQCLSAVTPVYAFWPRPLPSPALFSHTRLAQ